MTPIDVLLESMQAVARHGDSPELRILQAAKLQEAMRRCGNAGN